jgi:hypothetical protein
LVAVVRDGEVEMATHARRRATATLLIAMAASGLVACGSDPPPATSTGETSTVTVATDGTAAKDVPGQANIFGAGLDVPPAPGGGGAGVLPVMWPVPPGTAGVVTFPTVTGEVNPIEGLAEPVGAAGDAGKYGTTDVKSLGGISGVIHGRNGMFLVGVFLTSGPPAATAPERLDFTDRDMSQVLEPEIGQTFLVGDGRGIKVRIPDGATRLFLGFADGYLYKGDPGWYDNNAGHLTVTVAVGPG